MSIVLVTIWPSRGHYGPKKKSNISELFLIISEQFCSWGKLGHLGAVLCREYENSLVDHVAIKRHDGLNSDLLSLNVIRHS